MLVHLRELAQATDLPVNADFEGGYAVEPAGVAANTARCIETGIAGLSIEGIVPGCKVGSTRWTRHAVAKSQV